MFTFKLGKSEEQGFNYPKYTIILKSLNLYYFHDNSMFYYLVSTIKNYTNISRKSPSMFYYLVSSVKNYTSIPCKIPTYLILPYLYFEIKKKKDDKFNLSKLGTDYVVNGMCIHYRSECIGSYSDNYIFVIEPDWSSNNHLTDRTPLKRSYHLKEN